MRKKPSIFGYLDYPSYLKDWFEWNKETNQAFSLRYVADKCGFKSKSYLPFILKGEKNLSQESIHKLFKILDFSKKEEDYFNNLVSFKKSKTPQEKDFYWGKIKKSSSRSSKIKLSEYQYEFFRSWYMLPIREIVTQYNFKHDYSLLAKRVLPHIKPGEAKRAVETLLNLKLIKKKGKLFIQTQSNLLASEGIQSLAVHKYQQSTMELAKQSIMRFQKDERDVSTITIGMEEKGFKELKQLIEEFQSNVVKLSEKYPKVERVYQLNIQTYPQSERLKND